MYKTALLVQPLWRTVWRFLNKLEFVKENICSLLKTTIWPSSPISGHIPWENHNSKRHMYPNAVLLKIARTWKQPRCPSTDKWIKKLWYIYIMEYCSDIKTNEFESVVVRWMKPELVLQSEVSQKEKNKCIHAHMEFRKYYLCSSYQYPSVLKYWTYLQRRNGDADVENGLVATVGEREAKTNWEGSIDIYTLSFVKQITSGKLIYNTGRSAWHSVIT